MWSGNGKIYFFKQSQYWRFDPDQSPPVKSSYPRPSRNWDGLPETLDAALFYKNGFTYFFKNNQYWRFNDRRFSVRLIINLLSLNWSELANYYRLILVTRPSPEPPRPGGLAASPNLWSKVSLESTTNVKSYRMTGELKQRLPDRFLKYVFYAYIWEMLTLTGKQFLFSEHFLG